MLQFSLKSTRMVQKSELIYDLSWFLFLMLYPWSNTSRRCIFFVRCMWHFSIASLHVILHSGFCGISCVMLRFVLSPFFGLVMRAVLSVRRLGVLSLFALRHSVPSFLIVVRVRGHAGMWTATRVTAEHIDMFFDSAACGVPISILVAFFFYVVFVT